MQFQIDHDFHIHSFLSSCSNDPEQNPEWILGYARRHCLKTIVLTDHFWDSDRIGGASDWYRPQDLTHIKSSLPLPQTDGIRFLFGCETELDKHFTLGVAPETLDQFSFIIIPTTHMHMMGFTIDPEDDVLDRRAELYEKRLDAVLDMDLPFHKIGIAHLTCSLMAPGHPGDHLEVLDRIPDETFRRLFTRLRDSGAGFELNFPIRNYVRENLQRVLRPYRIAKACGCRFYFGSDGHSPAETESGYQGFREIAEALELSENHKFHLF